MYKSANKRATDDKIQKELKILVETPLDDGKSLNEIDNSTVVKSLNHKFNERRDANK